MPVRKRRTLVVVANGTTASAYENDGVGHGLHPLPGFELSVESPPTRELGAERPGRVHDRFGPGRHAMEPKADWHRQGKTEFARSVAERLDSVLEAGHVDRLVLVAPPTMMGDLRAALSRQTHDLVDGEITKDLTRSNRSELEAQIGGVLAV